MSKIGDMQFKERIESDLSSLKQNVIATQKEDNQDFQTLYEATQKIQDTLKTEENKLDTLSTAETCRYIKTSMRLNGITTTVNKIWKKVNKHCNFLK